MKMKKIVCIFLAVSLAMTSFAANPVAKIVSQLIRVSEKASEKPTIKAAAKASSESGTRLCAKYPHLSAAIAKNEDKYVSLAKKFGDDAVKHEAANPGIVLYGEKTFGKDGAKLLMKESPEKFFSLTKYFAKHPKQTRSYMNAYKIAGKIATPKNIMATAAGLGIYKICCAIGAGLKDAAEAYPAAFMLFVSIAVFLVLWRASLFLRKIFSPLLPFCGRAKKFICAGWERLCGAFTRRSQNGAAENVGVNSGCGGSNENDIEK